MRTILAGVVLVAAALSAQAQNYRVWERMSLMNVKQFALKLGGFDDRFKDGGLDPRLIQTDIELALGSTGIRVRQYTGADDVKTPPLLFASVNIVCGESGVCAFACDLDVRQQVMLPNPPGGLGAQQVRVVATTRHDGVIGLIGRKNLGSLRGDFKNLVDRFLSEWLAANPKE